MRLALRAVALAAGLAGSALATTFVRLTLEQQAQKADVIVHAVVRSVGTETRAGRPWTVYQLDPRRFLKGEAGRLPQAGGSPSIAVLGGQGLRMEGAPVFQQGQEVVLLAYARAYDSPVVGFRQGAYLVAEGGRVTDLDGRPVSLSADPAKPEPATLAAFLERLATLAGSR